MNSDVFTSSSLGTYQACPRRYEWAYVLGIRRIRTPDRLGIGSAYHAGIEALNLGATVDQAIAKSRNAAPNEIDAERVACMVSGWHWRWREAPAFRRVLATEKVFEFKPVKRSRWTCAGKIDVIGELPDGRVAIGEYKTASEDLSPGSDYWRRLLIDRQVSLYVLGARSLGYDVDTVVYDAARLPGLKPRLLTRREGGGNGERENMEQYAARIAESMGEKPDWYFARAEIPRLPRDIEQFRTDLVHVVKSVRASGRAGVWPRNTDACRRWGACPYFGPCADCYDVETSGIPNGYERVTDVHAELTIGETDDDDHDNSAESAE